LLRLSAGEEAAGIDNKNSEIIVYKMDGTIIHLYSVPGHSDGLKVDPSTHLLWALQNEEANDARAPWQCQRHGYCHGRNGATEPSGSGLDDTRS
jgi:hypothetical protein